MSGPPAGRRSLSLGPPLVRGALSFGGCAFLLGGLRLLGHSGGSSPNSRLHIIEATRVDARLATAPVPASSPDQISRLTSGLSVIGAGFNQT